MFFKNLQVYGIKDTLSKSAVAEQMARGRFSGCPSNMMAHRGWISPLPHDEESDDLIYAVGDHWLICLCEEKRLLPPSVVNAETKKEAAKIESRQGYAPGRKQLREIKESVIERLMPKAFLKRSKTWAWIDTKGKLLGIDAGSRSGADGLIEHMRLCLDQFPLVPINTKHSPATVMVSWLLGEEVSTDFTVDRECELRDEEKATVSYKKHLLTDEAAKQIADHLSGGKTPTKLALTWDDRLSFVLTDKLEVKRLAYLIEKESEEEDHASQFESDFVLMTGTLSRFFPSLERALGGPADTE